MSDRQIVWEEIVSVKSGKIEIIGHRTAFLWNWER